MKQYGSAVCCLALLLLTGGCWMMKTPESRQAETFDLASPVEKAELNCRFARIRNLSPAGRKMLYRDPGNRMTETAFSCWIQSPEAMLQRYLACRFTPRPDAPQIQLTLLRFELDRTAKQAVLTVETAVTRPGKSAPMAGQATFTAPLEKDTGAAAAQAMSICAEALTKYIITTIQEN